MRKVLLSLATLVALGAHAQLDESFSDGNFSAAPVWVGNTGDWTVVANSDVSTGATGSQTLRLNAPSGSSGTKYLSTQIAGSWGTQQTWGFWLGRRGQAATASNTTYVWLYANASDVTTATVDGYRIRFGDDTGGDNIVLESVTNGVATAIITSTGTTPNGIEDFGFLVRVTRDAAGLWTLYTSALPTTDGTGAIATDVPNSTNANVLQGSVTNTTITSFNDGYIAFAALHSTGSGARAGVEFDQLLFSFVEGGTLPVKFGAFKATQTTSGVALSWSNLTESDVVNYTVEHSTTGSNFTSIAQFNASRNTGGRADYQFTDINAQNGNNFYRIKVVETDGKISYSSIARITLGRSSGSLNIYPNPVKGNQVGLQVDQLPKGAYSVRIYSATGQVISTQTLNHAGGAISETLPLINVKQGVYTLELNGAVKLSKQFVVQ
jgi:hypothetical protein